MLEKLLRRQILSYIGWFQKRLYPPSPLIKRQILLSILEKINLGSALKTATFDFKFITRILKIPTLHCGYLLIQTKIRIRVAIPDRNDVFSSLNKNYNTFFVETVQDTANYSGVCLYCCPKEVRNYTVYYYSKKYLLYICKALVKLI